jgi:2-methylcitrate dehydratase PrpD
VTDGRPSLTRQLAAFAAELKLADVPEPVQMHAKLHVLDAIGCGIAGAASDLGRRALAFLDLEHRDGPCPVLGAGRRYGPAAAAFANAVAMNALDFDDGHEVDGKGMGHPSASLVAAALSAPFTQTVNGSTFLTALVAAYEVNARLIEAVQPTIERFRQVYGVCQHQGIGSAIAYGRQLDLDPPALENAIGFAATFANVPSLRKYNWERRPLVSFKDFNGPAAESGVRAVQFDAAGLHGARDVLDGESGFWRMIGSDRFDADGVIAGLGRAWRLLSGSFKPYAACRWMHTAMEALDALLAEHAIAPGEISAVTLHTSAGLARDFMDRRPATMVDAQFSFPFVFAALAYRLSPAASWYLSETIAREDVKSFADRVHAVVDPEVDAMMSGPARRPAGRVTIVARNTRFDSPLILYPRGSRERPMSLADVEAKFRLNAAPTLGEDRANRLLDEVMRLEASPDVASVFSGL